MSLATCQNCSCEVSDSASVCPECGQPISGRRSEVKKGIAFGGAIFPLLIIACVFVAFIGGAGATGWIVWFLFGVGTLFLLATLVKRFVVKRK